MPYNLVDISQASKGSTTVVSTEICLGNGGIARAERDGTCAKTRFRLSPNGRVHLNRWGSQFSRLLAAEVCASAWVMQDRPRSEVAWEYWLLTPFASFPFTSPSVRHRVPPGSERALSCSSVTPAISSTIPGATSHNTPLSTVSAFPTSELTVKYKSRQ